MSYENKIVFNRPIQNGIKNSSKTNTYTYYILIVKNLNK